MRVLSCLPKNCHLREPNFAAVRGRKHHEIEQFFATTLGPVSNTTLGEFNRLRTSGQVERKERPIQESKEGHDSGVREDGGITISWRPKRRASREKAPGPRRAMAAAMTISSKKATVPSNEFPAAIGGTESVIAMLRMATATLAIGVRNPTRTQAPQPASARHAKSTANV